MVNGFVYWPFAKNANVRVLNTATFQFSRIDLPHMEGHEAIKIGETKDGKLCLVRAAELTLVVWVWRADGDGVNRWMLDKTFLLQDKIDKILQYYPDAQITLKVMAIIGGIVHLSTVCETHPDSNCWYLSFCLETEKLNKLCPINYPVYSYPYIMAWPPFLGHTEGEPSNLRGLD